MAPKIDTAEIETYLEGLGKKDSKGKVHFERVLFGIKTLKSGVKIVLDSPDTERVVKNFKSKMIQTLMGKFKSGTLTKVTEPVKGINKGLKTPVIRLRYYDAGIKNIDFDVREYPAGGKSGAVKPAISEPATMMILNAVLESKKVFKTEEDIFVHDVYKDLEKLFGKENGHKLDSWIYTFLMQNKLFFKHYSSVTWAPFKHNKYKGKRDMQVFFSEHLQSLTTAPNVKVGRTYEQWNPADLWAVKRTEQKTLEDEITEATNNPSSDNLMKLNLHIVKLMEKKELVGISLKKIESGGTYKIFNVDSSKYLTNLKSWKALETFGMNDISFGLRNVFENNPGNKPKSVAATTYIYFGSKFKVDVTRSGEKIVFNSQIIGEKGAQGGQSPIQALLERLRHNKSGVTFDNKFKDYPATGNDFTDIIEKTTSIEYKQYKKWFNFAYKHSKNDYKKKVTFDEWANDVYKAYESRDPKEGKAKLALLNFWYDALKYHDKDPEFWTDMLYFGLKIISKGQFGPHVKIS
jgi:hypothetical protein